jgi:hypothetical protein
MQQPSMVVHACDVPGYRYKMDVTCTVPGTFTVSSLVDLIVKAAEKTDDGLRNLIFNSHGSAGYLWLGKGIGTADVGQFKRLKGKGIGTIWIVACNVGETDDVNNVVPSSFCADLARATGCDVVSADVPQYVDGGFEFWSFFVPNGYIDDYEGVVTRYSPSGKTKILGQDGAGVYDR